MFNLMFSYFSIQSIFSKMVQPQTYSLYLNIFISISILLIITAVLWKKHVGALMVAAIICSICSICLVVFGGGGLFGTMDPHTQQIRDLNTQVYESKEKIKNYELAISELEQAQPNVSKKEKAEVKQQKDDLKKKLNAEKQEIVSTERLIRLAKQQADK